MCRGRSEIDDWAGRQQTSAVSAALDTRLDLYVGVRVVMFTYVRAGCLHTDFPRPPRDRLRLRTRLKARLCRRPGRIAAGCAAGCACGNRHAQCAVEAVSLCRGSARRGWRQTFL
jgi:hypothetical protein